MKILHFKIMNELLIELITSPEDLEPGDVVVYASGSNFRTAKILKKPVLDTKYGITCFKLTKCMICNEVIGKPTTRWFSITNSYEPIMIKNNIQKYDLENFNKVKYIRFRFGNLIFKVIDK